MSCASSEVIDPLAGETWDGLLAQFPVAGPFHCAAWAKVLARTYGHRPRYLRVMNRGLPVALVPVMEVASRISGRRGVCVPFSDCAEPLVTDGPSREAVQAALTDLARRQQWKYVEVRGSAWMSGSEEFADLAPSLFAHRLGLAGDAPSLFSSFSASTRRAIRKSERDGVKVRISRSRESMQEFLRLHERTRRRHGAPPQPAAFFRNLHREMVAPGLGFVAVAERGGQVLGAAVFLRFGPTAVYKFGASDPAAWGCRPNNLIMAEAIRNLSESGCRFLHFGRTNADQSGLRRFKRSWGAVEEPLSYLRFSVAEGTWRPVANSGQGRSAAVFKRLPLALNRIAGRLAYPHLD